MKNEDNFILNAGSAEEWFPELDALQKSGVMNMFGAPRWLQDNFGMTRANSISVFHAWTNSKEKEYRRPRNQFPATNKGG